MSTEYQQVPSQQAFYSAQSPDLDPWLITATGNMTISWGGKKIKRDFTQSPPPFEDDMQWSPPTYTLAKKPAAFQYISTTSAQDPWVVVHEPPELDLEDGADTTSQSSVDDDSNQSLYKTELCRSYMETGNCRYGTKCQFAHGKAELRPVLRHPKYKTEICKTFHTLGTCPYGTRCRFIHTRPKSEGFTSLPSSPTSYASPVYATSSLPNSPMLLSRSPSPPAVVPTPPATPTTKWATAWPRDKKYTSNARARTPAPAHEDDAQVPTSPPSTTPKKRLAIFRAIC